MSWNRLVARDWALKTAREMGRDAFESHAGDAIWGSVGALYYAADTGDGLECRLSFLDFAMAHVGWDLEISLEYADEIEEESNLTPAKPVPQKPAATRYRRASVV